LDIHLDICWENNGAIYWNILGYVIKNWKHGKISYNDSLESPQMGGDDPPKKPSTNWLPGGAPYSLAISCCVAGNSLEDVLNAPGTVYYVDAQGRLYLKRLGRPKRWGGDMFRSGLDPQPNDPQNQYQVTPKYQPLWSITSFFPQCPFCARSARFLYEQNGYFEAAGVKQLTNGHRYLAGKVQLGIPMAYLCGNIFAIFLRIFHISPNLRP
jgi:hypothetical protein